MRIDIIQIDHSPTALRDRFAHYEPQFEIFFGALDPGLSFRYHYILDGDPFPNPVACDAIMLTGSPIGVYEQTSWIDPLRDFIRRTYAVKTPLLGVCFGHQIMADALGGDVRKSEKGWGLGRQIYQRHDGHPALDTLPAQIALPASHQDQVITPPQSAATWLHSDFCPHAGLIYDTGRAISLQPHPEWDRAYAGALVDLRRGDPLTDEAADRIRADLDQDMHEAIVGQAILAFLRA